MSGFDLSNFLASFFDEARERLSSINQGLVNFESGSLDDEGLVALRRDAHTIKGSALMLGVNDVGGIAHLFEDAMEYLIANPQFRTPAMTQFLYDLHDQLAERFEDPDSSEHLQPDTARAQYNELLKAIDSGETEAIEVSGSKEAKAVEEPLSEESPAEEADNGLQIEETLSQEQPVAVAAGDEAAPTDVEAMDIDLGELGAGLDFESLEVMSFDSEGEGEAAEEVSSAAEVKQPEAEMPKATVSSPAPDKKPSMPQGMIGAEEAAAWKQKSKTEKPAEAVAATEEKPAESVPLAPHGDDGGIDDLDNFHPDISKIELKSTGRRKSSGRFLRVDAERLEDLSNHIIELTTEQSRTESAEADFQALYIELRALRREWQGLKQSVMEMNHQQREDVMDRLDSSFDRQLRSARYFVETLRYGQTRSGIMLKDLRDQVLSLMLRPLDSVFSTFPRAVRDVAIRANKRVKLNIGGQSVEMDQGVAESLVEPLVHLLNNAVAHGIETPEERKAAGKPEEGSITILARQSGNEVRIEIIDDGRGIDVDDVKRVAVKRGVTTQVEADAMDSAEILEMIFRPGFSTHKDVDDLAGRGIGMNVVQDAVRRLTGSIRIHTVVGKGSRFMLSLPVSIAVQQALTFRMGNQRYGMLTHMIDQAVPLKKQTVEKGAGGKSFLHYGKHQVPIVDLRRMMATGDDQSDKMAISAEPYVLIAEHIEGYVGIVIDELLSDTEIVVRDLDPYIKRYQPQGLMGNTITPDGSVLLLLEPYGIKEMGRTSPEHEIEVHVEETEKLNFKVLLVDDSLIAREVEKGILQSIGFDVDTAIDGMDGIEKLQAGNYDMVITDLEMPRLDGFGFVRRMRNQKQYEELPIMVISTRESAEDRMRSLDAGADAYLVKQHLNGEDLLSTVQSLVGPLKGGRSEGASASPDAPIV